MKKTIALVLALVMVFALCACGAQTPETGDNAGTGNTGYNGKTAFGDLYLKWFYCMDGTGRKGDGPMFKQVIFLDHRTQAFGVFRL